MSHMVQIQIEVRNPAAVSLACERLGLPEPAEETHLLFSGEVAGLGVRLPGWNYPVVCHPATGALKYDNFGGRWGEQVQLDRFLQRYAVEVARLEARRRGHAVAEQTLPDGSIRVTVEIAS